MQFKLAVDSSASTKGNQKYDSNTPLVTELASDGQSTAGTATITVNGTTYDVVKSSNATNVSYYINDAQLPDFTGKAVFGNLNSSNQFVSGNGINYTSTSTNIPTLSVQLSTNGTSTVNDPTFYVIIPKGFTSSINDFSVLTKDPSNYFGGGGYFSGSPQNHLNDYSIKSLGNIGPKGEQVFQIKLAYNPKWEDNFAGQFKLKLDPSQAGSYTYGKDNPVVAELSSDTKSPSTGTLTIDGKAVQITASSNTSINYGIEKNVLPNFTGDAAFGNLNTSNKEFVSGNGINYTSTSTNLPTLSVRLSTSGTSTVNNPQFIVMIPKGFTSSTSGFDLIPANPGNYFNGTFNGSNTNKDYSIQDLGKIGPNGEQLFKVTLNFNPSWDPANNFGGQFKLSFDPTAPKKYYSYDPSGAPIVSELADDANPSATGDSNHYTFTAAGKNINVVKSSYYQGIQYGIDTTAIPEFTGTANFDANGKIFNVGDTIPEYTFRLSTWGNSTVQNPKFIVMIPAGFTATTNDFSPIKNATIESLGTDSNGQQLFEISLKGGTPNWGTDSISGSVRLTLTPTEQNGGSHTYSNLTAPLVSEVSDYAQPSNGTYTFHVGNKDINVVQSPQTVNWTHPDKDPSDSSASLTYTINTGTTALDKSEYSITNPSVTLHKGTTGHAGYEQLTFTITPKQNSAIKSGQYIDVKLGLPTSDGNVVPYDTLLANENIPLKAPDGTQIATAYKMGTYYRIVFNSNAAEYTSGNNNLTLTPILRWGNPTSQNPSINIDQSDKNNLGKTFVYEGTTTQSEDGEKISYAPQNDINIGDGSYKFTSGLYIQGQKVYTEKYLDYNKDTEFNIGVPNVRTWTSKNTYTNNGWFNTVTFKIATSDAQDSNGKLQPDNDTGTDFYLTVKVGDNSNFKYSWETGADVKNQIVGPDGKSGILAQYKQNVLGQTKVAGSNYSLAYTQDSSDRIKSGVTVDDPKITKTDGIITAVYHIKLANPDAKLLGELKLLTVSADGFTKPADIQSYQQDEDNAIKEKNYTGVATSNTVLQNALINTKAPQGNIQKISTTGSTSSVEIHPDAGDWSAYANENTTNNSLSNDADSSNTRTATLEFYNDNDPANPILIPTATNTTSGAAGDPISFKDANKTLEDLEKQGYSLEKVEDPSGNITTPKNLANYDYGTLVNKQLIFKVYLHYTDIQSISASQSVSNSISNSYSIQRSESRSESLSISEATSGSISRSLSNSIRQSESTSRSLSQSESLSHSTSQSESLSNSFSQSESLSNSLSQSESLSNSLSQSESLSNSLSQSESLSNSLSQSESLSNSLSQSESLSNSLSQSESLSNSLSESESLSNSLSESESLSNSLSQSESLSNSLSESESLSNSLSQSESLSNSLSESESLSNSLSESESLSNSLSQSESLSNSLSQSESLSNSLSQSESLSNSLSQSESLSNSLSQSESLSNSLSQSESLSNSLSESESLSNSLSQSESLSNSLSQSESLSNSLSQSESLSNSLSQSESLSNSLSQSESLSNSLSQSESLSNSLSQSESLSNSLSQSESLSNSLSQSESLSNSLSQSESLSDSLSQSESLSNSLSQSESLSNSLSQSESLSNSLSQSESLSNSLSQSESLSNSLSQSESLSNSLSQSESLSNSLSQSESLSNSLSQSESLSNSLSQSESLSNSLSQSESLSNSLSQSESLSNSLSQSESLSNSLSQSESLSNSLSQSESLSNSLSQSESLSNSLSQSESLSNSLSQSESLSNSLSQSESLSNSLSQSESLSNSLSQSESLSNSLSQSESLSNSLSQSESLSNSLSQSESLSNSLSQSESLSNSLSQSESLSNSLSQSESLNNSLSQSESLSNSLSQSESLSNSLSQSESLSNSLSQSESLSNSLSQSESLSNSLSQSESLSNSLSQSESLSNSLSQSESMSNSLSQSESLSNSLSQSESLSNSLSQSESLSNSLSQSESLSNSLSESESLSNSLSNSGSNTPRHSQGSTSQSRSLSNSLSESEASISNSISQSTSIPTHSEVIESTSETNSNTNNSESINSTTNPSISRPAESVSEQTSVNITPEKQPAESTEQQVSAKKHRVRTNTRRKLPQTGASTNSSSLLGLLATAVGGLLGLRRKKNRKRRR